ncbi:hypothetical protein ACWGKQ_31005 [Streptomyces sp. NPDC054770]
MDADTVNRELSIARKAIGWWQRQGRIEVLCLNVEDLYPQDKRGRITAKGGATEWIHRQSGTAQLLPRLIARRTRDPLILTDRKAPAGTPTLDVCRRPAGPGSPTAALRRSSRRTPGCRQTPSPRPPTSRTWTAGRFTGYVTLSLLSFRVVIDINWSDGLGVWALR